MTGAYRNQVARSLLGVVLSSSIVLASVPAAWAQQPMAPPAAQPLPPPPPPAAAPAPMPGPGPAQPGAMPGAAPATPVPPGPAVGAPMAPATGDVGPTDVTSDAPVAPKGSGYSNSKVPAYVAFGVAGVGLVAGTIFGISALSAKSTYKDKPTYDNAESVENRSMASDIGFATFVIAGVTGAIFYLTEGGSSSAGPPPTASRKKPTLTGFRLEPTVTRREQGAALTLRF